MTEAGNDGVSRFGQIKDKLIGRKEEWSREGRGLTGTTAPHQQRLPPGQHLVRDWPVLDLGIQPEIPKAAFRLVIDGAVDHPVTLDWDALMALPSRAV
jgi:Sulfite oxidase and related enzymes